MLNRLGSNYYPNGPHGQRQDPREVPLHPGSTGSAPPMQIGDREPWPTPMRTGPMSAGDLAIANVVGSFLLVCLASPFWLCLYPAASITAVALLFACTALFSPLVHVIDPDAASVAFLCGLIVALFTLYKVSRMDHRLAAKSAVYRWLRYFVRLPLLAVFLLRCFVEDHHLLPLPGEPLLDLAPLRNPVNLAILCGSLVGFSLLLWKAGGLRTFWHHRLEAIGLRPGT